MLTPRHFTPNCVGGHTSDMSRSLHFSLRLLSPSFPAKPMRACRLGRGAGGAEGVPHRNVSATMRHHLWRHHTPTRTHPSGTLHIPTSDGESHAMKTCAHGEVLRRGVAASCCCRRWQVIRTDVSPSCAGGRFVSSSPPLRQSHVEALEVHNARSGMQSVGLARTLLGIQVNAGIPFSVVIILLPVSLRSKYGVLWWSIDCMTSRIASNLT